jgi:hypothetical protein
MIDTTIIPAPFITKRCGRKTKAGKPCQQVTTRFEPVCKMHATAEDRELIKAIRVAFDDGIKAGAKSAKWECRQQCKGEVDELVRAELAKRGPCKHFRIVDTNGDQLVTVRFGASSSGYAYRWKGSGRLAVGDKILVPPGYWMPRDTPMQEATVIELGTDFNGEIASARTRL